MFNDLKLSLLAPQFWRSAASLLALVLICAPLTIGAIWAFPIWDDAWLWLLLKENGAGTIAASVADRPVMAALWWLLAGSDNAFWLASFVAQALLWPLLGVISALLWIHLFPGLRRYAVVVACIAVAPIVSKVQMITANIALGHLLSVVLAYGSLLLLLRFVTVDSRLGRVALGLSIPMLGLGILVTEYAMPVVIVMLVLVWFQRQLVPDPATRLRALQVMVLVTVVAGAGYVAYVLLSDPGARPGGNVYPFYVLTLGQGGLIRFPFRFVSAAWQILASSFMPTMAEAPLASKAGVVGAAYGALVAGLLVYGSRNPEKATSSLTNPINKRSAVTLVVAFGAGLLPMVAMERMPWNPGDGMSSRFVLPLQPITAALMVVVSLILIRKRFWAVPVILFGFAAGNSSFTEAWSAIRERQEMSGLGAALQAHISANEGYTVAAVALPERTLGPRRPYELTVRLAATWPPELRRKFWAVRFGGGPPMYQVDQEAEGIFGSRGDCEAPRELKMRVRLVTRVGPLNQLIWVKPQTDGSISVEPFCIRAG
jgi:hypothetical protein